MKVQMPMVKPQPWVLPVTLVCLALGMLIAMLTRVSSDAGAALPSRGLEDQVKQLQRDKEKQALQLKAMGEKYNKAVDDMSSAQKASEALLKELNDLRLRAGSAPAEGPGIVITIDDSNVAKSSLGDPNINALLTHDTDLQRLVNELRAAGAEEIAINDQRVGAHSAIRCVGPVVQVNFHPVAAPFIVSAIGKQDVLNGAALLPSAVLDELKQIGIKVTIEKKDLIHVPAIAVLPPLTLSRISKTTPDTTSTTPGN
jgi:uncharacterized protein YlxW (UPF0749 family)